MILFLFSLTSFNDIFIKVSEIPLDSAYYVVSTGAYPFEMAIYKNVFFISAAGGGVWAYKKDGKVISNNSVKRGEAPEEIHRFLTDIGRDGEFLYLLEERARLLKFKVKENGNLKFEKSFLLKHGRYTFDFDITDNQNIIVNGISWEYDYRRKQSIFHKAIHIYSREGELINEFYTPSKKFNNFQFVTASRIIEFSIWHDTIWVVPKFINEISIFNIDGKLIKRIHFKSSLFVSPRERYKNPYSALKEEEKYFGYQEKWLAGCTMLDNIVTMKDGKRIFVYNWGYKNHNKRFFLLILSKDGKTIAEVPTDYRLITCDRNNNLYFLTHFGEDIKHPVIGIYKIKEGNR